MCILSCVWHVCGLEQVATLSEADEARPEWLFGAAQEPPPHRRLPEDTPRLCFGCGCAAPLSSCAKCGVAGYCGRQCQAGDWGKQGRWGGHKAQCAGYQRLGRAQRLATGDDTRACVEGLLARLRLYLCPFALCHGSGGEAGGPRGFCLVQCATTLDVLALPAPRDCAGRPLPPAERAAMLQFTTVAEFDEDIAPIAPERLGPVRAALVRAVESHDDHATVVVLVLTPDCEHTALLLLPLVPAWRVAKQMAAEYEGREAIELQLDDL